MVDSPPVPSDDETAQAKASAADADSLDEDFHALRTQIIESVDIPAPEDAGASARSKPSKAHECLEIRTPLQEFETYVRARIETLTRLGEADRADLALRALELGRAKLARHTGAPRG
jgi:hypothetical protein